MADQRRFFERLIEVVQDRIDEVERVGLRKLEEVARQRRREAARAAARHERRLEKLDRDAERERKRAERHRRRRHRRGGASDADGGGWASVPVPPAPPAPGVPPAPPVPGVPPAPPAPPAPPERPHSFRSHRRRGHRRRSHSERSRRPDDAPSAPPPPPAPEDRAYARARRRANRRLTFYMHAATYGGVLALLLFTTRSLRVVAIVGFAWGIGLFLHHFWMLTAPRLRERWIEREVDQRTPRDVSQERVRTEGRHTQNLEELSASIAHEIRNPIAAAKSLVQQMDEDPTAPDNIEFASVALQELDRVERSISHLLRYAREEELRLAPMEMADVIASAVETFRDRFDRLAVDVRTQVDARGAMRGDAEQLRRVLINLVANALDAFDEADTPVPVLHVMSGENLAGDEVWVRVRDNGPGIDDETRTKIWSPFYTTKESGTGLGLAISRKIVDAHGGQLEMTSRVGEGTEFVLTFPKNATPRERGHAI